MVNIKEYEGAIYADIALNGKVILSRHDGVIIVGEVGIPLVGPDGKVVGDGLLRQLRCSDSGLRFAGIGFDDNAWEWADGRWNNRGPAYGPNSVIYKGEELLIHRGPTPSGYRYIAEDGRAVTAEETYADTSRRLWEWTTLGDVTVSQGAQDGLDVLLDGQRGRLTGGQVRFIRMKRSGDTIALAWQDVGKCFSLFTTKDALKRAIMDAKPVPKEEPKVANEVEKLNSIRGKYPTPLGTRHGEFLLEAARLLEGDLLKKDAGTFITLPDGATVAQDIIVRDGQVFDFLQDGEGLAHPIWDGPKGPAPQERVYKVTGAPSEPPVIPPLPPSQEGDLKAILAALVVLQDRVAALERRTPPQGRVKIVLEGVVE